MSTHNATVDRETGERRLRELADLLDSLPPERFSYASWVGRSWEGDPDLSCGTTACALGWATTMPELRRAGLSLGWTWSAGAQPVLRWATTNTLTGLDAAMAVFGLADREAWWLFMPGGGYAGEYAPDAEASAQEVAAHIRYFLDHRDRLADAEESLRG